MMTTPEDLTPDLARAARALTQVSARVIGRAAGLEKQQVRAFEKGKEPLAADQLRHLRRALEEHGVVFIPDDDQGGCGVRRKFNSSKVRRLETWEGEGGPAYEDDI
ncbi:XRE family transcriptional regulator [Arthrobacter sp. JSM 101049]|uniref:XRE family transcriptional regulator n=1 Tax=Arthrobacter sp. JSM 101049 TaxID=929097 RepID=UPI00356649D5